MSALSTNETKGLWTACCCRLPVVGPNTPPMATLLYSRHYRLSPDISDLDFPRDPSDMETDAPG